MVDGQWSMVNGQWSRFIAIPYETGFDWRVWGSRPRLAFAKHRAAQNEQKTSGDFTDSRRLCIAPARAIPQNDSRGRLPHTFQTDRSQFWTVVPVESRNARRTRDEFGPRAFAGDGRVSAADRYVRLPTG